jgi:hypothetical protein
LGVMLILIDLCIVRYTGRPMGRLAIEDCGYCFW